MSTSSGSDGTAVAVLVRDRYNAPSLPGWGLRDVPGDHMPNYAVIDLSGKQYRVHEGERIVVDRLALDEGASFAPRVLATGGDGGIDDGGNVTAIVEEHFLGPKVRMFFYKAKGNWSRRRGHRSRLTRVRIDSIAA